MKPVQMIALAAAGYFAWSYLKPGTAAPPPSSGTTPQPATPPPAASTPAAKIITSLQLRRAAAKREWAAEAGPTRLNFHEWNYYRKLFDAALATPAPEDAGAGDGSAPIDAITYHSHLQAMGLSGLVMAMARRGW
ncbi:MAG TPA: hypothetical protein VER03_01840 [Bryobacteraceae bacterium]|nr:hypothetical protein [Bryobacteraceae bacterium]